MRDNGVMMGQADEAYRSISADEYCPILIRAACSKLGMKYYIISLAVSG